MKFSELIELCIKCVEEYNDVVMTLDSHADNFLESVKDPYEKVFINQIFYGCVRYKEFLKVFVNIFYKMNPVGSNRNDKVLYSIFGYLSFFRLEELAIEDYKKLILSQDALKMHNFLQFTFNADGLRDHVREGWMELYDFQYLDDKIIGGIEKNRPNVSEILRSVEKKATGKVTTSISERGKDESQYSDSQSAATGGGQTGRLSGMSSPQDGEIQTKKVTEMKPFNLTKPKPKVIPRPLELPRVTEANPIPNNLFKKTVKDVEKEKEDRRKANTEAIRKEYDDNEKKRFALATEGLKSTKKFDQTKDYVETQI